MSNLQDTHLPERDIHQEENYKKRVSSTRIPVHVMKTKKETQP